MATFTVGRAKHATLTAGLADSVTVSSDSVEVKNRGAGEIYFRADGTPTVGGDDTYVLGAGEALVVRTRTDGGASTVQLISSATCAYSVTGV